MQQRNHLPHRRVIAVPTLGKAALQITLTVVDNLQMVVVLHMLIDELIEILHRLSDLAIICPFEEILLNTGWLMNLEGLLHFLMSRRISTMPTS
jgi:hypothetical protein